MGAAAGGKPSAGTRRTGEAEEVPAVQDDQAPCGLPLAERSDRGRSRAQPVLLPVSNYLAAGGGRGISSAHHCLFTMPSRSEY